MLIESLSHSESGYHRNSGSITQHKKHSFYVKMIKRETYCIDFEDPPVFIKSSFHLTLWWLNPMVRKVMMTNPWPNQIKNGKYPHFCLYKGKYKTKLLILFFRKHISTFDCTNKQNFVSRDTTIEHATSASQIPKPFCY